MPRYDPKTGMFTKPRRTFTGCAKLCRGFSQPLFSKCLSICTTEAQTGTRRGFSMIPRKGTTPCKAECPRDGYECLRRCLRRQLVVPKRRERLGPGERWA